MLKGELRLKIEIKIYLNLLKIEIKKHNLCTILCKYLTQLYT